MPITDDVSRIISGHHADQEERARCDGYERANRKFERLVEKGVVAKRGYRLMSVDSKIRSDTKINYYTK